MIAHARFLMPLAGIATLLLGLVGTPAAGTPVAGTPGEVTTYQAVLSPLNSDVNGGDVSGLATFVIDGDQLEISIGVDGVAPGISHLQHFHGFAETDQAATCPTMADDANGDGVLDIVETETKAGTTMVPFTEDPANMEIVNTTYPMADESGSYVYEQTVSLSALQEAFAMQFNGQDLNLDKRVVFIHTVPADTDLPGTAQSLDDIPAQVTLPIACGVIELVPNGTPEATPVR
ncbi:MAG TPA: hypothetical protein VNZ58_04270 [Thermomicrobiales bacterium]|nr:hypothetical protein [Thermomicrobiales bacterium]